MKSSGNVLELQRQELLTSSSSPWQIGWVGSDGNSLYQRHQPLPPGPPPPPHLSLSLTHSFALWVPSITKLSLGADRAEKKEEEEEVEEEEEEEEMPCRPLIRNPWWERRGPLGLRLCPLLQPPSLLCLSLSNHFSVLCHVPAVKISPCYHRNMLRQSCPRYNCPYSSILLILQLYLNNIYNKLPQFTLLARALVTLLSWSL